MLIAAAVMLVIALVAAGVGVMEGRQAGALSKVRAGACAEVSDGPCEVNGQARAEGDPLQAPDAGVDCVYYEYKVTRRWKEHERDSDGHRRTESHSDVLTDVKSELPFRVADDTGSVLVDPRGADIDAIETVLDQRRPYTPERQKGLLGTLGEVFDDRYDDHLEVELRCIRPGATLFVHGHATSGPQGPRLADGHGHYVISGRTEEALSQDTRLNVKIAGAVAGFAGVVALGLGIAGVAA